jgi:hypothetical protein
MGVKRGLGRTVLSTCLIAAGITGIGTAAYAAPTTTITVWIDCEGCKVTAVNAKNYFSSNGNNRIYRKSTTVRGGKATLRVPAAKTKAMAFEVSDTPYGLQGSVPTVALKRKGNQGSWCWSGTARSKATLRFSVKRWINHNTPEAAPEHYNMAVWATPSVRTWRDSVNMKPLRAGGLGHQHAASCESR